MVVRRTPEREVGVRSSLRSQCCVLEQDAFTSQKVLVLPRKRWHHPDMTEKLFTGMLSKNETKKNAYMVLLLYTLKVVKSNFSTSLKAIELMLVIKL